jgi:hypothetical protein
MMNPIVGARALDIQGWFRGLLSAGISGGASVIAGAIVLPSLDSHDFNVFTAKYYVALGALFCASALVSISKFLVGQPLPDYKEVTTTVQTVQPAQSAGDPKVITTTMEKHVEPIVPKESNIGG